MTNELAINYLTTSHHANIEERLAYIASIKYLDYSYIVNHLLENEYFLLNINEFLNAIIIDISKYPLCKLSNLHINILNSLDKLIDTASDYIDNNQSSIYIISLFQLYREKKIYLLHRVLTNKIITQKNMQFISRLKKLTSMIIQIKCIHKSFIRYLMRNYSKKYLNYILNNAFDISNKFDTEPPIYNDKPLLSQNNIAFLIPQCKYYYQFSKIKAFELNDSNNILLELALNKKKAKQLITTYERSL